MYAVVRTVARSDADSIRAKKRTHEYIGEQSPGLLNSGTKCLLCILRCPDEYGNLCRHEQQNAAANGEYSNIPAGFCLWLIAALSRFADISRCGNRGNQQDNPEVVFAFFEFWVG